nr:VPA1262 family N-terminal domain-containing protein [Methanobrevibacter smithii]
MIIQEFYWDDEKILTIIHEKMEDKIKNRTLREETEILGHKIIFKEYYNENSELGDFEHDFVIDGFLECNNVKNPYSNYSAQYKEYVNQEDTPLINNQQLSIDTENFKKLCKFVKENCNFNLTPSAIGNLLVFLPIKIDVKSHNSENLPYLTIEGSDACGTAFVKFKLDDIIREYYVLNNIYDGLEIWSKRDWDNYEIEIFNDENLIYKAKHNIIRAINLNVGITTKIIEKKYQSIDDSILITNTEMSNPITISDNTNLDFLESYLINEKIEMNKIKNPKESYCNFLKQNERKKAFELFKNIIEENNEMWIFDPFFISDNLGIDVLIDILITLCSTSKTKNIVFTESPDENEEKNMTFNKYKSQIEIHGQESLRDLNLNSLKFIKATDKFHDRFIFLKNDENIIGYQIGTSLNSFGTNYSNIIKLNDYCAKTIFKILFENVVSGEIYILED